MRNDSFDPEDQNRSSPYKLKHNKPNEMVNFNPYKSQEKEEMMISQTQNVHS